MNLFSIENLSVELQADKLVSFEKGYVMIAHSDRQRIEAKYEEEEVWIRLLEVGFEAVRPAHRTELAIPFLLWFRHIQNGIM